MNSDKKKKVIVAMSGGVDSSVTAALLKQSGLDVSGIFMKLWKESEEEKKYSNAEKKARLVTDRINIPFYVFNFKKEFKKIIINDFLKNYKKGITPNPCIICNKKIKFGLLFKKLLKLNFNFIATGHYVRIKKINGKRIIYKIFKGKDKKKDQSYFLWRINQSQLKHTLFPLGNYNKKTVKNLAKKFKLPVINIPESQEICFIKDNINDFLSRHIKLKPGKIIDTQGKKLGEHQGLFFYTIGQRKGIGLPGGPYYVLYKNLKKNLLIVTKKKKDLSKKRASIKEVNWVSDKEPKLPLKAEVKIRYRGNSAPAVITKKSKNYIINFKNPQCAITAGQSAVFYRDDELLGGGVIIN